MIRRRTLRGCEARYEFFSNLEDILRQLGLQTGYDVCKSKEVDKILSIVNKTLEGNTDNHEVQNEE